MPVFTEIQHHRFTFLVPANRCRKKRCPLPYLVQVQIRIQIEKRFPKHVPVFMQIGFQPPHPEPWILCQLIDLKTALSVCFDQNVPIRILLNTEKR